MQGLYGSSFEVHNGGEKIATTIDIRDYWDFVLCPSSCILMNTEEYNVSETGLVSVLR
jgi:hypothetical protein